MTRRRIIGELAGKPRAQIEAELAEVRAERERLDFEEALLTQVLRLQQWADDNVPGATETVKALAAAAPEQRDRTIIANVDSVVQQAQGEWLGPADVDERLRSVGVETTRNNIRVALRRLTQRGRIERDPSSNRYRRFPSTLPVDTADETGSSP